MLSFTHRFHGYNSLRFVYKNGAVSRCKYVTLKATKNPRRTHSRVSIVVSRKISKRAVKRNRIRRRLYEWFRRELPNLESPIDVVCVVTSPELITMSASDVDAMLRSLVTQANLYKDQSETATIETK